MLDTARFLEPLDAEAPCGRDLEYEPDFQAMEQAARGKPEQQYGDTIIEAEPPDWKQVRERAFSLLEQTRDLRVATYLTLALTATEGLPGLRDGLMLLQGMVEHYWESVYPLLDPEDDYDPTVRLNAIANLTDPESALPMVRAAPALSSKGIGTFSLEEVLIASEKLPPPKDPDAAPDPKAVTAAAMDADMEGLRATQAAVDGALGSLDGIEAALAQRVQPGLGPDLAALRGLLKPTLSIVNEWLAQRGAPSGVETVSSAEDAQQGSDEAETRLASFGQIRTRDEVVQALDAVCAYYSRHEPSSPVPILLERAKVLVAKDFMEILRNLAPDGVSQAEAIRGPDHE